jgi:hypothetical protein
MPFTYTTIDGQRVESAVARSFAALAAEFQRVFGMSLHVRSGTRTRAEQQVLWDRWVNKVPGASLAAKPGSSNHEEYGPRGPRALDLYDSGADQGVTTIGTKRSNWLAANAPRFNFDAAGHRFTPKEGWHYEYTGNLDNGQVPGGPLNVDGEWGAATTSKLQSVLGVPVDGQLGPQTISALQRGLGVTIDGALGPETVRALQAKVGATVDGALGSDTIRALQIWLNKGFGFTPDNGQLQVDGQWGPSTTRKFQHSVGATEDGELGPATWSKFQAAVGITADGQPGPETYKALQMNVGAAVDGALGPDTISKLQAFLNEGKAWTKVVPPAGPVLPAATPRTPEWEGMARAWLPPYAYSIKTGALNTRPAGTKITKGINHHTGATSDQEAYFKSANERVSCPHVYFNVLGEAIGFIPLHLQPSSTGSANVYSIAIETQNSSGAPLWGINDLQREKIAQFWAWVVKQEAFEGVEVQLELNRQVIIGHNEAGVNATSCPGPSFNLDAIVVRAAAINNVPPVEPPVEPVPTLNEKIKAAYDVLGKLIDQLED